VDTPLIQVLRLAYDARMRFDDDTAPRALAAELNASPTIVFRTVVSSSLLADNTDPVVVIRQDGKIIKSLSSTSDQPDPESNGFFRSVTGTFNMTSFAYNEQFDVIVSHISDRGREQLIYYVHPENFK
jgi:hypothetical protein